MKLTVKLGTRKDDGGKGSTYFLAKGSLPVTVDFSKGVAFLIFTSDEGCEEMQISQLDEECLNTSFVSVKNENKMKIRIYPREDKFGKTFYIGKVKTNASVNLMDENSSFMIWNSLKNKEELQISGHFDWRDK